MLSLRRRILVTGGACLIGMGAAAAQSTAPPASAQSTIPPKGPAVSMSVAGPSGTVHDLTTHESGLATLDVNGHQYGFRPTMHDDAGARMTVTIFDMGEGAQPVRELAAVDVSGGGPAVASKSSPAFRVKASKGPPQTPAAAQSTRRQEP